MQPVSRQDMCGETDLLSVSNWQARFNDIQQGRCLEAMGGGESALRCTNNMIILSNEVAAWWC